MSYDDYQNPYADTLDAVWRDPMGYDPNEHSPPYLPVTVAQREEARVFAKRQAAYYDVPPKPPVDSYKGLSQLLAFLRALYMVHQTAHWQTRGGHYYSDHILFQRIYEESLDGIDSVAERVIGLTNDPSYVSARDQAALVHRLVGSAYRGVTSPAPDVETLVKISLAGEVSVLNAIDRVKQMMQHAGTLSEGLDDLLQGLASKHEEFVYLLQQRVNETAYSYDHRG